MGTFKVQLFEAFRRVEEAVEAVNSLTNKIRQEIGEEQQAPATTLKLDLFSDGLALEKLRDDLLRSKARYEEQKASIQTAIEEVLVRLHQLENEHDSIEEKYRRVQEIYQDLFEDTNVTGEAIAADRAYRNSDRALGGNYR